MKDKSIIRMKLFAERDRRVDDGAFRLLSRITSDVYVNPKVKAEDEFPLPWSKVAGWCNLEDDKAAYRRVSKLVSTGYLVKCDTRGCPPTTYYTLNILNCPSKGAIKHPSKGANVTPEKGAINSPEKGAHHISTFLKEEKIKRKREDFNGSLRSQEQGGDSKAAAPKSQLTDAQREQHKAALAQLRESLKDGEKTKPLLRSRQRRPQARTKPKV